jgi:hypothetical protein
MCQMLINWVIYHKRKNANATDAAAE